MGYIRYIFPFAKYRHFSQLVTREIISRRDNLTETVRNFPPNLVRNDYDEERDVFQRTIEPLAKCVLLWRQEQQICSWFRWHLARFREYKSGRCIRCELIRFVADSDSERGIFLLKIGFSSNKIWRSAPLKCDRYWWNPFINSRSNISTYYGRKKYTNTSREKNPISTFSFGFRSLRWLSCACAVWHMAALVPYKPSILPIAMHTLAHMVRH